MNSTEPSTQSKRTVADLEMIFQVDEWERDLDA
jgi:hypothetical protein